ncbi:MAG TPA: hypothetical protein VGQ42_16440 [Candidatus Dormibacteraeota bacterium]|nr:hypothetical protein [Candidatus Dormibacteraeota bacterium]
MANARLAQAALALAGERLNAAAGLLDAATTEALIGRLLAWHGGDPECTYYFWSGRSVVGRREGHSVYRGPLSVAPSLVPMGRLAPLETPSGLWPADCAWGLAVHTDSPAAYLGGPESLVAALTADEALEVDRVALDAPLDLWA